MGFGLISGRAGAGKTEACIEQIRQGLSAGGQDDFILLTPEQATFANEKRILAELGSAAGFRVKVLSFRRFAHMVLQETGGGTGPTLDAMGKNMILRCILERRKQELRAFGRVWDKAGFVRQLSDMMDELRTYRIDPEALVSGPDDPAPGKPSGDLERGKPPGDPEQGKPPGDLADKLADIHRIYLDYEAFLSHGWLDFAGELSLVCRKLGDWQGLVHTHFWLDGFHGFTPAEFSVIRCLLRAGCPVNVTLTLPGGAEQERPGEDALFYPTWETADELRQICRENGIAMAPALYLDEPSQGRFARSPDLAKLERRLAFGAAGETAGEAAGEAAQYAAGEVPGEAAVEAGNVAYGAGRACDIHLVSCGDTRQEVERLAIEILESARDEKYRFRDMAVLLRDPEAYRDLIDSILPSYGIPYFFDGPKTLRRHPLLRLLRELTVFMQDRWNTGTLMAYMKTGLAGLTDHQGFALENYCLAHGIRRMHWESPRPWSFTQPEEKNHEGIDRYMERLRQTLWQPIEDLRKNLGAAQTMEEAVTAVYRHLIRLGADATCSRMANAAMDQGAPEEAQIHQRAWQEMMKLFDQTVTFMAACDGGNAGIPQLLAALWESGLDAAEMAALPPALDQVTICSMDRSRSPQAEIVWIPGANEGLIPAGFNESSLLDTQARQWLAAGKVKLAPDSRRRMLSEAYLVYVALTRAAQRLHISYARADTQGGLLAPSPYLDRLCQWFPGLTVDESRPAASRRLNHPAAALQLLGQALQRQGSVAGGSEDRAAANQGRDPAIEERKSPDLEEEGQESLWRYVYRWFTDRREYNRDIGRIQAAYNLAPLGRPLPPALAQDLFGKNIRISVTRLERFQACPFAHYLAFGLALEPREEYEIQPPEIGNFFHDSLEALMKEMEAEGVRFSDMGRQELDDRVESVATALLESKNHTIFLTSAWYRRLSDNLRRILRRSAEAIAYQESRSRFTPYAYEASFGFDESGNAPPVSLDLGGGREIRLRGRIDRIDRAVHPLTGQPYLRIVDYKSGQLTLALYEIYHGLKHQLILYLEAAMQASPEAKPAGLFYFRVHDPMLTAVNSREAGDPVWREEKMMEAQAFRGYLLGDRDVAQMMDKDYAQSLFLPVSLLKSGDFSRQAKILSEEEFGLIRRHSRYSLRKAGQRIMDGDISLRPYRSGQRSACDFCPYAGVCRFDPLIPGHNYRYLPALPDEIVLRMMREEMGEEGRSSAT